MHFLIGAKFISKVVQFLIGAKFIRKWCFFLLGLDFMHLVQVLIIPGSLFVKGRFPVYYTYPKHMNSEW